MTSVRRSFQRGLGSVLLLLVFLPAWCRAAAAGSPAFIVGELGAYLYTHQDDKAERISKLERGEELMPLASSVGAATWYLVKTQKGVIGWVKSSDLSASHKAEKVFQQDPLPQRSTWSAVTESGRTFGGTWSAQASPSASVSGTWTWRDATDKTLLRGTWSAEKFSTGWNGVWHAVVDGQSTEYSGTWTAALSLADHDRVADLLEAAVSGAVRGVWAAGNYSGVWSITGAK